MNSKYIKISLTSKVSYFMDPREGCPNISHQRFWSKTGPYLDQESWSKTFFAKILEKKLQNFFSANWICRLDLYKMQKSKSSWKKIAAYNWHNLWFIIYESFMMNHHCTFLSIRSDESYIWLIRRFLWRLNWAFWCRVIRKC